ncbi:lisH domain-containing protein ARMC9-like isoform X2 [Centruroides sculpturatus]|uniref:lisH domain-containing protein ARMC9-like isoform X2 n=1 Tax=Centruroides sculpturatus TaxID=218467 RepID=UPI000C6EF1DB|nr:lisH domain-containing protein ARMC9-like isoform X2 [Centruroides sculpturatus]
MQEELNTAEIKWKESERKNSIQSKQLVKLQEDCRVLMTVLNNFIAALESAVKGDLTDLDDVLSSCMQRFPEVFNLHKISENEFNYHQSNHKILPKSVKTAKDVPIISSLDFLKIKKDILQLESKKVALLLQALRWRITKQSSVTLKTDVLMMYIEHDILNLEHTKLKENFLDKVHNSTSDILQTFLRFLNTIASFPEVEHSLCLSREQTKKIYN